MDLSSLNEADLEKECPYISIVRVQGISADEVGSGLSNSLQGFGINNSSNRDIPLCRLVVVPPRNYWKELKHEFYLLLCTKDKKYSKLRKQLDKSSNAATTTIVSTISVTIAAALGTTIGIITPLVALLLYAIIRLSVNSWCKIEAPIKLKKTSKKPKSGTI